MNDPDRLHQDFTDDLTRRRVFASERVGAAFRAVPRHRFLPGVPAEQAYRDRVIVTKVEDGMPVSASSQPSFMAVMLEQLELEPGQRVLEIGAGCGYNAALMAEIVGRAGQVVSVELDAGVARQARGCLDDAGYASVEVVRGDGGRGHAAAAPYDRIIVTAGAWDIPPALRDQLGPGGRLVIPLSLRGPQRSIAFERVGDVLFAASIADCDFSTNFRGDFAGPMTRLRIGAEHGVWIWFDGHREVDRQTLARRLSEVPAVHPTGHAARVREIFGGLFLWLALQDSRFVQIGSASADEIPCLLSLPGKLSVTAGLLGTSGLVTLGCGEQAPATSLADPRPLPLSVGAFGYDVGLADRLLDLVSAWNDAGRPGTEGLRISAYPMEGTYYPSAGELVIDKRWSRLVLSW